MIKTRDRWIAYQTIPDAPSFPSESLHKLDLDGGYCTGVINHLKA